MLELIDALAPHGVESHVVVPEEGYVTAALQSRDTPYVVYRYRAWTQETPLPWWDRLLKKPLAHMLRAIRLSRLIRRWRCDVIVTNTLTVCEGALAARILRLPHITYAREFGDLDHSLHFEWGPRLSVRLLSLLSTRVAFNSAALARHYRQQVPLAQARVIYNAVSITTESLTRGEPADPRGSGAAFSCVLVGYMHPGKGHEDAIRAIANLARRGMRVNLKLVGGVGSSDYLDRLRRLIDLLGVSGRIEIVGHVPDAGPFFREADVALMCSRMEAFGRVTVEAMKLGTAVIGARSGGTSELIRDGFNGFLYEPGDAWDLADKIERLARDRHGAHRMGERARRAAMEMFSLDRYGREFLDLLREVTEPRAVRAVGRRSAPSESGRMLQPALILVVDDDPLVRQWLAASLAAEGHDVDVASDAWTALARLEQTSYDLIVSDLRMPELDGVALYHMLERERPQVARRMMFLTGNMAMTEYREFVAENRDRTVAKPVDVSELNRLARRILATDAE